MQICPFLAFPVSQEEEQKQEDQVIEREQDENAEEELVKLGQERAGEIKRYLMEQHGISGDRLLVCTTVIVKDEGAISEVRLQL